ncbi:hypothetical protein [Humibacter albus]|uniref:hypothetical protein n=1 Tax=Humibacter albus TaxID=427754 RepID=UPI0012F9A9DF|nr:hypothetical protein [Humibacter albus]
MTAYSCRFLSRRRARFWGQQFLHEPAQLVASVETRRPATDHVLDTTSPHSPRSAPRRPAELDDEGTIGGEADGAVSLPLGSGFTAHRSLRTHEPVAMTF